MKVIMLTNIPAPYSMRFFSELGKLCDLTVLFEREEASDRVKEWLIHSNTNFNAIYLKGLNYGKDKGFCPSVILQLKKKYDVIVVGNYSTLTGIASILYLWIARKKFVILADGGFINKENILKKILKKKLISKADYWLSTSKETDQYFIHYGANANNIKRYPISSVMSSDIDQELISEDEKQLLRNQLKLKESKIVITVGQLIFRKGIDILIAASKKTSADIGYYIIGGKPTKHLLALAEGRNNIHFIDFKQKDELREYYHAADLFVLPTREDIWGYVVHEAMTNGLPVITTNRCNAGLEMIEDSVNGYLIGVENVNELSARISESFQNPIHLKEMARLSLERSREYTIEKMAFRNFEIFKLILENKSI